MDSAYQPAKTIEEHAAAQRIATYLRFAFPAATVEYVPSTQPRVPPRFVISHPRKNESDRPHVFHTFARGLECDIAARALAELMRVFGPDIDWEVCMP